MHEQPIFPAGRSTYTSRRQFLQLAGGLAGTGAIFSACKKALTNLVRLGSGDTGILNFMYALEQLEAQFYTLAVANTAFTTIFTTDEQATITEIRDHEIAHREFLKVVLGKSVIYPLNMTFSSVNFTSKSDFLGSARDLEDAVSAGYNYATSRLSTEGIDYLRALTKIASVEARHATAIKDMISYSGFNFADTADGDGLDKALKYSDVNILVRKYMTDGLDYGGLP